MAKALKQQSPEIQEATKKVRTSMYIDPALLSKIQYISFMDDGFESQTDFITDALYEKVKAWEKIHGEAVKK